MSRLIPGAGLDRTDIETPFSVHSLSSEAVAGHGADRQVLRILPEVNVIKIGGQSIMDRGAAAVLPLVAELRACAQQHPLLLGVGGGTRARHAYAIALDLGMPTSVLAKIGAHVPVQNARMLQLLLAQDGGILIDHEAVGHLPLYYRMGCVPILPGMPPFSFWEPPARVGRIPTHRTDAGVWLTAEGLGARRCIFVKDEDGLYTANPKDDPRATFIPRIHAAELLARKLPDCVVEPVVLEYMLRARLVREIQIINGLKPGTLTRALAGEPVGTIIHAD
ncbi:MAG: uridine kinase [Deltaproteobacteria bacterium]|nr:uridine kinase [Deltaproteobacteria bacterium]